MSFAARIAGLRKMRGGFFVGECDLRGGNGGSAGIRNGDDERTANFLCGNRGFGDTKRDESGHHCSHQNDAS